MNHVLSVDQFDLSTVNMLTRTALEYQDPLGAAQRRTALNGEAMKGKLLANLFYEPSTRTSSSFYAAMTKLGGSALPINDVTFSSVSKGENLEDTVRTLDAYADVIVLRHPEVGSAARAAAVSPVPIINAGDGAGEHPTQALLDLYTIRREQKKLLTQGQNPREPLTVTFMGDLLHGRTVHSLVKLLRLFGSDVQINFVSPAKLGIPLSYFKPGDLTSTDLNDFVEKTDVLYVTRVQKERHGIEAFLGEEQADYHYSVTPEHMARAKPTMTLMHPLPRVGEIPPEIDADPRAAYFRQVRYGLFMRMAVLLHALGDRKAWMSR